ncbi:hypothetical protein L207DRAFT_633426 [Hyaloscypha variabilis F]|uniref:RBR-type E3 ubiquitin transferase n=1 Tax=Hyaloscypha variabilis (strain UAMH 11265 / GT02V1 / F) TaxID=1149755 RepID=A0A2J6RPF8_HYAVF|nr:hypothetical protein L207DRAFT_633426 [Hyaloscypha variabilis F]
MVSPASKVSGRIPGGPPGDFQEWDGNNGIRGNGKTREVNDSQRENYISLPSIYGNFDLPLFGPQYGSSSLSLRQQRSYPVSGPRTQAGTMFSKAPQPLGSASQNPELDHQVPILRVPNYSKKDIGIGSRNTRPEPHEAQPRSRNLSLGSSSTDGTVSSAPKLVIRGPPPTSCIICTEDFSSTTRKPRWISSSCLHHPHKIWNQIKCPECEITLIYDDIRRFADPDTFARYDTLSFRSAVGAESNFVWCQNCDFGQLHASGELQPIIRCLNCGFRCCFRHSVQWHDRLTCDEYDEMLQDPDGFRSAIDRDDEVARVAKRRQEEEDDAIARDMHQRERQVEQDRQRQIHEEQLRRARAEQQAEARRMREELEMAHKREAIKKRQEEERLSLQTVQVTTKPCPGCRWPIEKNQGCSHMTCIKCHAEFCWVCLNDYLEIRRHGLEINEEIEHTSAFINQLTVKILTG